MPATDVSTEKRDVEMAQPDAEVGANGENGETDGDFKRPDGCWGWHDNVSYDSAKVSGHEEKGEVRGGDSFEGQNKEGESKDDPEKALKDSRGGAGVNALDKVKADEGDAGTTSKVCNAPAAGQPSS